MSDVATMADTRREGSRRDFMAEANVALAVLLWVWLAAELWFEWSVSEQYGYGLFVPALTAYLVWLRIADCPAPQPRARNGLVLAVVGLAALAQYPIAIIFAANADWRLLAWAEALLAMAATTLLLLRWGGWPWVRHFTSALVLMLFAVPWPSYLQISLVDVLMTFVATVTTEILNFLGYLAIQQGHIIQLHNSFVSVEEACSGVRSIQSTMMAGWLVGELWRFGLLGRAGLLAWAAAVAIFFNLARTLALALLSAGSGPEAMEHWHDTAGYLVYVCSFASVLTAAWLMRPRRKKSAPTATTSADAMPGWLPRNGTVVLLVLLTGAWPVRAAWYAAREPNLADVPRWGINIAAAAKNAKVQPAQPALKESLYFDQGEQATWTNSAGLEWYLYFFEWNRARAAQLGGVHSPESCLPAVGWVMGAQYPDLVWERGPLKIIFNVYEFIHGPTKLYVFYGQWDPAGYPYNTKTGRYRSDRLEDAWRADRKDGKQLLEIALANASSPEDARHAMQQFLDAAIVEIPAGKSP